MQSSKPKRVHCAWGVDGPSEKKRVDLEGGVEGNGKGSEGTRGPGGKGGFRMHLYTYESSRSSKNPRDYSMRS